MNKEELKKEDKKVEKIIKSLKKSIDEIGEREEAKYE